MYKKNKKAIYCLLSVYMVIVVVYSCSSREEYTEPAKTNSGTVLTVNIAGVEEPGEIKAQAISSVNATGIAQLPMTTLGPDKITATSDFDIITNAKTQTDHSKNVRASASTMERLISPAAAVQVPVSAGVKYRILLYDAGTNALESDVVATVGINPNIQVSSGKPYKWYMISTNDANVPGVTTTTGVVAASSISNKDVLYAQGTITPMIGQNSLNAVFKHNTVQFSVDIDTRGLFGVINNTTAVELGTGIGIGFSSIVQTGDFNLFTGTYSNFQNVTAVTGAGLVNKTDATGATGATKTVTFYTVKPSAIPLNSLSLRMNRLDLTMDNGEIRSFSANTTLPFNNTAWTTSLGFRTLLTSRLIESGVKIKNLLWARSNLYYAENVSHADKYRFHPNNEYTISNTSGLTSNTTINLQLNGSAFKVTNEYWNWMAATPTGPSSDNVDPCSRVYPAGTWRMPTSAEFLSLEQPDDDDTNTPLIFGGARISSIWNRDTGEAANPNYPQNSRSLFISLFGYRTSDGSSITDSPGSLLSSLFVSGKANYWSSTHAGTNNANYHIRSYRALLPPLIPLWGDADISSDPKSEGRNIRCVRTLSASNT